MSRLGLSSPGGWAVCWRYSSTPRDSHRLRWLTRLRRRVTSIGWLVTGKVVTTKDDQPMDFVSFEDTTAIYETTFFPRAYERCAEELGRGRGPFLLLGTVDMSMGAPNLSVERAALLR